MCSPTPYATPWRTEAAKRDDRRGRYGCQLRFQARDADRSKPVDLAGGATVRVGILSASAATSESLRSKRIESARISMLRQTRRTRQRRGRGRRSWFAPVNAGSLLRIEGRDLDLSQIDACSEPLSCRCPAQAWSGGTSVETDQPRSADQLADRGRLVAGRIVGRDQLEWPPALRRPCARVRAP